MLRKAAALLCALALLTAPQSACAAPLHVVATFSILGDLVKQIGGESVAVETIVGPGEDAHMYRPTPQDSARLAKADLVVINGLGFEGWMDRLVSGSGYKGPVVVACRGIAPRSFGPHRHGGEPRAFDPHAWQDVSNVRLYVKNIATALADAKPRHATAFAAHARSYDKRLAALDAWIKKEMAAVPTDRRKIITSHDAFEYFGQAYGVTFLAPQGISTEIEPSPARIAALLSQIKKEKVHRVFFETLASPTLIRRLAEDAHVDVGEPIYSDALSPPNGPAPTYIDMMRLNATRFKDALTLNGS
ncbi:MAG: metal ABC transporter substrate-binding protein [Alphaproteobacteria bacterium]|nr:metal ABC transporter substrate-binding protein [Alphaproteobacteria bacterium]